MSKTILVKSFAGFIGSHMAQAFLARGDASIALDNLNDYHDSAGKRTNLEGVLVAMGHTSRFTFVEGDVRCPMVFSSSSPSTDMI